MISLNDIQANDRSHRISDISPGVSTEEKRVHGRPGTARDHANKRELLVQGQADNPRGHKP